MADQSILLNKGPDGGFLAEYGFDKTTMDIVIAFSVIFVTISMKVISSIGKINKLIRFLCY